MFSNSSFSSTLGSSTSTTGGFSSSGKGFFLGLPLFLFTGSTTFSFSSGRGFFLGLPLLFFTGSTTGSGSGSTTVLIGSFSCSSMPGIVINSSLGSCALVSATGSGFSI